MEAELRQHITDCAAAFAAANDIELVTVSRRAAGDWRFIERISSGASFTARKYDETMRWFSANWPDTAPWPHGVPRPQNTSEAA